MRRLTRLLLVVIGVITTRNMYAQGGPPMITDDPGTPGNGHFENNFAVTFDHQPNEWLMEVPAIDLNYGVGGHIQLNLQTSYVIQKRSGHGALGGLTSVEAAVKWRFLDEKTGGIDMSVYPRIIFNISQASIHRGLAEDGTRVQCPVQLARKFGSIDLDVEIGPLISTVGRSEWLYGIVGGIDVTKTTALMVELHGTSRSNFTRDAVTANVGLRQKLTDACILITSVGHDVYSPDDTPLALIGYFGVQLLY